MKTIEIEARGELRRQGHPDPIATSGVREAASTFPIAMKRAAETITEDVGEHWIAGDVITITATITKDRR